VLKSCFELLCCIADKPPEIIMKTSRPKRITFCCAVIVVLLTSSLARADCINDRFARLSGRSLVGESGYVYRIFNTNGANIEFWMPLADLVVCDQLDANGNNYISISNKDTNETVFAEIQQ
jgi:hypothetical protein